MVLLKNENHTLPLNPKKSLAVIGAFAKNPRIQGGGSSHINPRLISTPYDTLKDLFKDQFSYADGYSLDTLESDETLLNEAIEIAKNADQVVIFAGLPDLLESEGYDRAHLNIPASHDRLIERISQIKNVTVILMNGSPVVMPWINQASSVLEVYLPGQNVGEALLDILIGKISPSGKLAESFPEKIEDLLAHQNFPGSDRQVVYKESIFVGYRDLNTFNKPVLFPFGHGLSYSTFKYSNLSLENQSGTLFVSCEVVNEGPFDAYETIQVYVKKKDTQVLRASQELKGFKKEWLKNGENKTINIEIPLKDLEVFIKDHWVLEAGEYLIQVGASSRDIRLEKTIHLEGQKVQDLIDPIHLETFEGFDNNQFQRLYQKEVPKPKAFKPFDLNSKLSDYSQVFFGKSIYKKAHERLLTMFKEDSDETLKAMFINMFDDMPIRQIASMMGDIIPLKKIYRVNALTNRNFKYFLTKKIYLINTIIILSYFICRTLNGAW